MKKFYSIMSQAILLSENDNGPSTEWDRTGNIKDEEGNDDNIANAIESYGFFSKYIAPYMKTLKIEQGVVVKGDDGTDEYFPTKVYLIDGSIILLNNGSCMDLVLDVNGNRKPNKSGRDMFTFLLCPTRETLYEDVKN